MRRRDLAALHTWETHTVRVPLALCTLIGNKYTNMEVAAAEALQRRRSHSTKKTKICDTFLKAGNTEKEVGKAGSLQNERRWYVHASARG